MADVVPQQVQSAEGRDGIVDDPVAVGVLGEIGADSCGPAPGIGNFLDHRVQAGLIDVDGRHLGAFRGKAKDPGPSHAGGRSRNQSDFVFQSHGEYSSLRLVNAVPRPR